MTSDTSSASWSLRWRGDRGSGLPATLILLPLLLMFMQLIVFGGRMASARADVNTAASEAARQASLAPGYSSADDLIDAVAQQTLEQRGMQCTSFDVQLGGTTAFGPGGVVEVQVECIVDVSDLIFLDVPLGTIKVKGSGYEGLDQYRVFDDTHAPTFDSFDMGNVQDLFDDHGVGS